MNSFRGEMYKESNSAALQYARNAIQFAFFLNGAAATALFAKSGTSFISSACIFAVGAAFATICMGGSYLVQMLICETWRQPGEKISYIFCGKLRQISHIGIEWFRIIVILLWVISMVCFFIATFIALSQS